MSPIVNTVVGALKLVNLPDIQCFENFEQLLEAIATSYVVEVPTSITNVVVGASQPGPDQTSSIWIRIDAGGNFIGNYVFSGGSWKLAASLPQPSLIWWNDSRNIPDGFELVEEGNQYYTSAAVSAIRSQFVLGGTSPDWYAYCAIIWVGY